MTYPAPPDMIIPYNIDGTVVMQNFTNDGPTNGPVDGTMGSPQVDYLCSVPARTGLVLSANYPFACIWFFFPEARDLKAFWLDMSADGISGSSYPPTIEGSNDTTNGIDGTWTAITYDHNPTWSSDGSVASPPDAWRNDIALITGGTGDNYLVVRVNWGQLTHDRSKLARFTLYGHKHAGETPDDLIFLNGADSFNPYTTADDFGNRPLGPTNDVHTFKVKNTSGTLTATTVTVTCDNASDTDFQISDDNATWVTSLTPADLAPGVSTPTLYIRSHTAAPGGTLGPNAARLIATAGSWV